MIDVAVLAARAEAVTYRVTASTAAGADDDGYPLLWAVTWRVRSAAWMIRHEQLLQNAMTAS